MPSPDPGSTWFGAFWFAGAGYSAGYDAGVIAGGGGVPLPAGTLDLSADQAVIDGLETVTLVTSAGSFALTDALRLRDDLVEGDPSEGGYLHRETIWHLSTLQAYLPKPGDTITDAAGVVWVALEVTDPSSDFQEAWKVRARESSITADATLADEVTLYPSVDTGDTYGSKISTHTAADGDFTGIPAKIQLRASTPSDRFGQRQFVERYDIYVDEQLPQLHNGDVIKDSTGKVYTVISWRNRELIDELSVIECELRITPRS